jgi:hypothetical protein
MAVYSLRAARSHDGRPQFSPASLASPLFPRKGKAMTIVITIDTSGASFDDDRISQSHYQVGRLVRGVANWFDTDGPFDGELCDENGNTVGSVSTVED